MTPDEMRKAIAETCPKAMCGTCSVRAGDGFQMMDCERDPLSDLNAMHEAEKVLKGDDRSLYHSILVGEVRSSAKERPTWQDALCHATAAQRAEAYCRTLFPEKFQS